MKRFKKWFNTPFGRACGSVAIVVVLAILAFTGFAAYWVSTSGLLTSGAYVCASDAGTVHLNMAKIFHGVYGDRVGWCDGTADEVQIEAAFAVLPNGGEVKLSLGTFAISSTINMTSSNTTLSSQGRATMLSLAFNSNCDVIGITGSGVVSVGVKNLRIYANSGNQTSGHGIYINTPYVANDQRHVLQNLVIQSVNQTGVYIEDADIREIVMEDVWVQDATEGFYLKGSDHKLTRCSAAGTIYHDGFKVNSSGLQAVQLKAFGCGIDGGNYAGFNIDVSNNSYFVLCEAQDNYEHGWYTQQATSLNVNLTNCIAHNNGYSGSGTGKGLYCYNGKGWQIIGGSYFDNDPTPTQQIGIHLSGSADNCTVIGTSVFGNTYAQIVDDSTGSNRIESNQGYVTENEGTGSIASGTTSDVITHGCSANVTRVFIMASENTTAAVGHIWITSMNATSFTVNVAVDPGASNMDYWWQALVR